MKIRVYATPLQTYTIQFLRRGDSYIDCKLMPYDKRCWNLNRFRLKWYEWKITLTLSIYLFSILRTFWVILYFLLGILLVYVLRSAWLIFESKRIQKSIKVDQYDAYKTSLVIVQWNTRLHLIHKHDDEIADIIIIFTLFYSDLAIFPSLHHLCKLYINYGYDTY